MSLRDVLCATALGIMCLASESVAGPSVSERLAEGAAIMAAVHLGKDAEDESGRNLLAFALTVDRDNERALLLKGKLDRDETPDPVELDDGGQSYVEYLEKVVRGTSSTSRSLLLYKVIELIDPDHKQAIVELTRAKARGSDLRFETLLATIEPKEPDSPKSTEEPSDGSSPEGLLKTLEDTPLGYDRTYQYVHIHATHIVNKMIRALEPKGINVHLESRSRPTRSIKYTEGRGYAMAAFMSPEFRYESFSRLPEQLQNPSCLKALLLLCALHNLGWLTEGDSLVLRDAADLKGPNSLAPVKAADLVEAMKADRREFLRTYRGEPLLVYGLLSGVGTDRHAYAHLAGDALRVELSEAVPASRIEAMTDRHREMKQLARERSRDRSDYAEYVPIHMFVGIATCKGLMRGRVALEDCRYFADIITLPRGGDD